MAQALISIRDRFDRAGVVLSGLCAVHCLLSIVLVSLLGIGGQVLLSPAIHEIGLALAIAIALFTIGLGVRRHGRTGPLVLAGCGVMLMGAALLVRHGPQEAVLTIAGVCLLAFGHIRNLRHAA